MDDKKRISLLILIMASSCLIVAGITISMLYTASFDQQKARLSEIAQSQARLIEAIARFNKLNCSKNTFEATLKQISDAHSHYRGFGKTGEFTLGKKEGDQIVFLLSHRHYDLDKPKPVPWDSNLAEPMRQSLSGYSGMLIGYDYRGETVLAAYEHVAELNWGIAAKIDMAEIREPFINAGIFVVLVMILVVLIGTLLFIRISEPILRNIEKSRKWLNTTLRSIGDGVIATDNKGNIILINPIAEALTGYEEKQAIGKPIEDVFRIINEETRQPVESPVSKVLREGRIVGLANHTVLISQDGNEYAIDDSGAPIKDDDDEVLGVVMVFRDISERRKAENDLIESELRFTTFMENLPACAFMKDSQGRILFINKYLQNLLGLEDWKGKTTVELIESDVGVQMTEDDRQALKMGSMIIQEIIKDADGHERVFDTTKFAIRTTNGKLLLGGISVDVTGRKKAENAFVESIEKYYLLFTSMPSGFALHDIICNEKNEPVDYRFIEVNPAFEKLTGLKKENLIGKTVLEVMPDTEKYWIERYGHVALTGKTIEFENFSRSIGKWYRVISYSPVLGKFTTIFDDITVRKQAEEALYKYNNELETEVRKRIAESEQQQMQLAHAGRLSSLGEMATGIAHELNQPLSVIRLSAETLILMLRKADHLIPRYEREITSIIGSIDRAAKIINHIRDFGRTRHSYIEEVCLKEAVENSLIFFKQQFRVHEIWLTTHYDDDLPKVKADPQRFEQILVNLLSNARYAVNKRKEQESDDYQKKIELRLLYDVKQQKIVLEVNDNGIGMSADEKERCLDPFYTTKEVGEGTGLGLSISHGIISEFNGNIEIESEMGVGTTIRVIMPVA